MKILTSAYGQLSLVALRSENTTRYSLHADITKNTILRGDDNIDHSTAREGFGCDGSRGVDNHTCISAAAFTAAVLTS